MSLEYGKKYRIKGTDKEFWLEDDNRITYTDHEWSHREKVSREIATLEDIANALATNDYEEVKVKKTFYMGVSIYREGNPIVTTYFYDTKEELAVGLNMDGYEIVEREFEV